MVNTSPRSPSSSAGSAAEPQLVSGHLRVVLLALGWLCVGLGGLGVVLPVLPTTPFLLLAAACFARSSPRFYNWLLGTRLFGPPIRRWRESRTIARPVKALAILTLAIVGGSSAFLFLDPWWARGLLLAVLAGVSTWILRVPSAPAGGGPPRT